MSSLRQQRQWRAPHPFLHTATVAGVCVVALSRAAAAQEPEDLCERRGWGDRDRHCEVREYSVRPSGTLEVDAGRNGGIRVLAWDRDEVRVLARVEAWADSEEEARRLAGEVVVTADADEVRTDGPDTRGDDSWGVSLHLMVPSDADLDLRTRNGGISLEGVRGRVRLNTLNGGVRIEDAGGDIEGITANGGVKVVLAGDRWAGAGLDVETRNGGVDLSIPEDYSAELETGTRNGSFRVDFPILVEGRLDRRLRTRLGQGGPLIRVVTSNGGVVLRRN